MMAEKARMFGDRDMLGNIMEAREPKAMKAYGRAVKNFDKETWDAACYELVKWKGSNLLGFALTEARDLLLEKEEGMD